MIYKKTGKCIKHINGPHSAGNKRQWQESAATTKLIAHLNRWDLLCCAVRSILILIHTVHTSISQPCHFEYQFRCKCSCHFNWKLMQESSTNLNGRRFVVVVVVVGFEPIVALMPIVFIIGITLVLWHFNTAIVIDI